VNFLAHFHLAWPDRGLVAGGLEGDYYKGPLRGELPAAIERGVELHRAIDAYTDSHPVVGQLRGEFPAELRRYAGILIDLVFDHYLSLHWSRFSEMPLGTFNRSVYDVLRAEEAALSAGSRAMLQRLLQYDILARYRHWETVPASAARIGERLRGANPFTAVDRQLAPVRERMEAAFLAFYPELQAFSAARQAQLGQPPETLLGVALEGKSP
jgi:acyl carrier protein phosphodiesterase